MKNILVVKLEIEDLQSFWGNTNDSSERTAAKNRVSFLRGALSVLESGISEEAIMRDKELALKKRRLITDLIHRVKTEQAYGDAKIQKRLCSDIKKEHGDKSIALQLKTIRYILED